MTLNLLLGRRPTEGKAVILADPVGGSIEPALAGLISQLGEVQRVMFPLPDDTTRRHLAPPSLMRSKHSDLWHALGADERSRVLLVAGPTATYLAPVVGPEATAVVAVCDPGKAPTGGGWRSVLGPFPELDDVPGEAGSGQERDRWLDRVRTATSQLELVQGADVAAITKAVAARVGLGPKAAARAATVAASAGTDADCSRPRDKPAPWLDEVIYSLASPPKQERRRQRRRRSAGTSPPPGDSPPKAQRSRKRRQK
jgi:hypothetical protein